MLALLGFLIGGLTSWIALKMLHWDKEEKAKKIKEDTETK